jgi:hypothetical protein
LHSAPHGKQLPPSLVSHAAECNSAIRQNTILRYIGTEESSRRKNIDGQQCRELRMNGSTAQLSEKRADNNGQPFAIFRFAS